MISKSLLKKSGLYFIGNLSSKMLSALLIPIYAFYIHADDFGYFDFSQTLMGILAPIIILAIWEAVLKFVLSEDNIEQQRKIMTTSALFSFALSVIFIISAILFSMFYEGSIKYLGLIIAMIVLHSIVYVWQYYARASGSNKLFVVAGIISTFVNFIFVIILVVFGGLGLLGLLLAYNAGQIATIVIIESKLKVISNIKLYDFNLGILKKMILFSSPLVLNLTSSWLIAGFARFIITLKLGTEENGLYSFANKFALIIAMIGSVVTMALIEEAIISAKKGNLDKNFNKTLESLFKVFQSIALLAVPAIVVFYAFISETDYHSSIIYIPWLFIFVISNTMSSNIGSVFQAINKTKYQFMTTIFGGVITVILSLVLIDGYGISAVIAAQILGAVVMMLSRYVLINKFIRIKINWKPIIARLTIFIVIAQLCLNLPISFSVAIEMVIIGVMIIGNRKLLLKGWSKIRKVK